MQAPDSGQIAVSAGTGGSKEIASLPGGLVERAVERVPPEAGTRGSRMSLWPFRVSRGHQGPSVQESAKREMTSSTWTLNPPPPVRRHLFYPWAPNRGTQDGCGRVGLGKEENNRPNQERQFSAASEVGRWARERLLCSEWDAWLRNLRACLPRAPPGLLERRLIQFLDGGVEAARDLQQPDFLPFITCTTGAQHRTLKERPILSGYRWQF